MIRSIRSSETRRAVTRSAAGLLALSVVFVGAGTALADTSAGSLLPAVSSFSGSALFLKSVSCVTASFCEAVGGSTNAGGGALAEVWNGSSWKKQPVPAPAAPHRAFRLNGVSCVAADTCEAVGYYSTISRLVALAERWNGTSWTVQPSASLADTDSPLAGVSCTAANVCEAVGFYSNGSAGGLLTLAEVWNGSAWKKQKSPHPGISIGTYGSALGSVSCTAADSCEAVGDYTTHSVNTVTLAEEWNGSAWTQRPTPDPGHGVTALNGVSCTAVTNCEAIGDSSLIFAAVWNGTAWKPQSVPQPSGTSSNFGYDVSCPSASACEAVGTNNKGVLTYRWDGTVWRTQSVPGPASGLLDGISCLSANACEAVGYSNLGTLVEVWNGTAWKQQASP
jgi:hypothetical protein